MHTPAARAAAWIVLSAAALLGDYVTGPEIQFPILFALPVVLAAWYGQPRLALGLAALQPLGRLWFESIWHVNETLAEELVNAGIQISVFLVLAAFTTRIARQDAALKREVVQLRGLLPTCMMCKNIREEDGSWVAVEKYVSERSEAQFSHGLCPPCAREHYGEWLGEEPAAAGNKGAISRS